MSHYYNKVDDLVRDMQRDSLILTGGMRSLVENYRKPIGPSQGSVEIRSNEVELNSDETDFARVMLDMQLGRLILKNIEEPGSWSLAQNSRTLIAPLRETVETRCIEVELYSAIPVPTPDVSLEDILDFKRRRNDELESFRSVMDALYQEVIAAADIPRAKLQAIVRIERAIQELNKVFGENFSSRFLSSLKVELNLPHIATVAVGGAAAASVFGIPLEIGAAAGAIAAAVKFDLVYIRKGKPIPDQLKDYAYLHHIERELG